METIILLYLHIIIIVILNIKKILIIKIYHNNQINIVIV
jgi:hypothetical protein